MRRLTDYNVFEEIWNPVLTEEYTSSVTVLTSADGIAKEIPSYNRNAAPDRASDLPGAALFLSYSRMQIRPPLPSLIMRSSVSESLTREASGIWASLVWMLSPTSS